MKKQYKIILIVFLLMEIIIISLKCLLSEIIINNPKLNYQIIISLTTTKENIESLLIDRLIKSLLKQTIIPFKILISIKKTDIRYISNYLKNLIKNDIIEIIFIKEDLKKFNRYYYIPDEYKKYIIIVVDDDITLEKNAIKNLYESYKLYPNAISARRVYKMHFNEQWILKPFYYWDKEYSREKKPKYSLFAIHGAGALFPPNILNFREDFIFYFKNAIIADDFIIKYFELQKNLKTIYVYNERIYAPLNNQFYEKYNNILSIHPNEHQLFNDFSNKLYLTIYKNIIQEKVIIYNETKNFFLNTINTNIIKNDTLLVSITSYPARIVGIYDVFLSLLNQSADISSYQCFLTLAKEEFINAEKDLPLEIQKLIINGWIKIIWYHNIYSHKKIIPIIQNYPENDILILDDDIIRIYNFIELFQKDHRLYPNDIICGAFMYYYDNNIKIQKLNGYGINAINAVPNIIFQTARPSNGAGGVLYPKHTFSDIRFFNESLYMNLTPTSDESWQYTFNIIENKIIRQTSFIIDNSVNTVKDSQNIKTCLYKVNRNKYSSINQDLIVFFPEYKINSLKRQNKIIISLTSSKLRLKNLNVVLESIFNNTMKPSKIVLTLYKKDLEYLTKYLIDLINKKRIELIVTDIDLKSHKKYFETMKKYKDYAIITIDDNLIYTNDLIESLYNSYLKYPNCIHARRVHKIMIENKKVLPYYSWLKHYTYEFNPSFYLLALSGGGTLFPPNILNISDENIKEINKCLAAEDIYIKYISRKNNIKIVWVPNNYLRELENTQEKKNHEVNNKSVKLKDACLSIFPII